MDVLSAILAASKPHAALFSRAQMQAPYGVRTRGSPAAIFHIVLEGRGTLYPDRGAPVDFKAGDLVILCHGDGHVLADDADSRVTHIGELPRVSSEDGLSCVVHDGEGARTEVVCGTLRFGPGGHRFVLPRLPPVLHVPAGPVEWLDATVRLLAGELAGEGPGSELLVQRLTEVLVIQALRVWIERGDALSGWPAALRDPRLTRALEAIHAEPRRSWPVAELSRRAGMSRSGFYTRFGQVMGEPPATYLTRWRMVLAQEALRREGSRVAEVADSVGYGTEAAFCRAFKREVGATPARWRRQEAVRRLGA